MSFLAPSGKKFGLHTLMAMSTMVTPTHSTHMRPLVQAGGGDAISEVAPHQLYLSHGIQDHIRQIFEDLCAPRSTLERVQLADFLKNVQQEEINLDQDEYKFEEFMGFVYYHGAAIRPVNAAEKDLTKPISNYYISSSHNTYLSGNQLASKSSTDAYKNVLIRGCRCIEIDVHNGESPDSASDAGSNPSSSPKPEHKRHLSGSTLSSRAGAMVEKAEQKYEKTKALLAEKIGKDKDKDGKEKIPPSPSMSSLSIAEPIERPPSTRSMRLGEPLVLHGWTLTTPVGFRAVCQTIRDTAFETSNLPIIVSLEVHADLEQQEIMVDIMKEEWKGMLVEEAHEACNPDERLPRLEEVLNKILIKVKKAAEKPHPVVGAASLSPNHTREQPDSGASGSEDERASSKKKAKICPSLSALGIYTHSEHFTSFESKAAKKPPHVFSIGERQIMELHEKKQSEMFTHNRDYFMRAYPAGFRFDSSNLDPSVFWRKGVQMVALNWQMWDEGMMLNEGMFAGENGWVLKPRGYRSLDPATNQAEAIEHKTLDLKITIFAGQHVPVPDDQTAKGLHPYIKCELHVEKSEERTGEPIEGGGRAVAGEYKHQTPFKKGDHPDFGPEGFQLEFMSIPKVVEELSFIRFKVEDSRYVNDSLAAWACIRLDRLQQGYRFVSLLDSKGQATPGLLMVKIEKTLR